MNILLDALPKSVSVHGRQYKVRTSFRDCLRVMVAFEDNSLVNVEKQEVLLINVYHTIPQDVKEALKMAHWFLNGGDDEDAMKKSGPRVYSFSKDSDMIFSAFKQVHGIDLDTEDLHWWKFMALFQAVLVSEECAFGSLVTLRYRLKTGRATKEEKAAARSIPDLVDVPELDTRTLEQKDAERLFFQLLEKGKRERGEIS